MRHIPWIAALAIGAFPLTARVQQPPQEDPYSKLAFFEGKWTVEGQESTYLEVCEWFQNRRFLICKTEDKEGGTSTWGMSIFGYSRETNAYTHTLFGSGPVRTIHGWLGGRSGPVCSDNLLKFLSGILPVMQPVSVAEV